MRVCGWCDNPLLDEADACPACGSRDVRTVDGPTASAPMNTLAVVALALSLIWFVGIASAAAVALASVAKAQINERHQRGDALATAALVLGIAGLVLTLGGLVRLFVPGF